MVSINSNSSSLGVDKSLSKKTKEVEKSFERLSSGRRVNKASDDPAGLAIAVALLGNANTSVVAARNISDGFSASAIADGSISTASDITSRMSELATQSANGTLSDTQRQALDQEYQSLKSELDRIAGTTQFNGQSLLSGSGTSITLQAGTDGSSSSQITLNLPGVSSSSLGLTSNIATQANAEAAIAQTATAVDSLAQSRGEIGATENRLAVAYENLKTSELNQRQAASRILDVDAAEETARLTSNKIGQQAAISVKAQANAQAQVALKLLG